MPTKRSLPKRTLTAGTRTSKLALWQTNHVIHRLQEAWPGLECHTETFVTKGDKTLDKPLPQIGGKGLFTAELERALHQGEIDVAVHSLKDLPVENAPGLTLGAIASRADVYDGLVANNGWTLETLPTGAVVGTSSVRRQAQLLAVRPDLIVKSIRGNVGTRVRKVKEGQYDAAVLAAAGLQRLDLTEVVTQWLPFDLMLPAPGQGALAVQCRADDEETLALLAAIDDADVRAAVTAERTFLDQLGGGCSAPIAAYATVEGTWPRATLTMQALVATTDGRRLIRVDGRDKDGRALGTRLAKEAMQKGATDILSTLEDETAPSLPLQGKRIVVTRARHQAQSLSDKLSELGATPVVIPAIRIAPMPDTQPLDRAIAALSGYNWLIFTSSNGVEIFWQRLEAIGLDSSTFDAVKAAAVGPATARALRQHGVQPDFVPDEFVGEAIAAGLGDDLTGQRILLPRAEIGREKLVQMLVARGAHVDDVPSYRTLPATMDAADLAELERGVDAITFTSGSTARNFVAAVKERADGEILSFFENTVVACIGPVTAEAARELGLDVDVVATEYTTDGLVEALATYFKKGPL